ncbi:MAG: hypothetical protein ACOYNF_16960, partial [Rhodoferax sp.]
LRLSRFDLGSYGNLNRIRKVVQSNNAVVVVAYLCATLRWWPHQQMNETPEPMLAALRGFLKPDL